MTDDTAATDKRRFRRTLLIFALAGPYIGLALSLLAMGVVSLSQGTHPAATLSALAALGIVSAVFAIPVGGLPGLLTGFVAASLQRRGVQVARYYALTATVGALATLAIPLMLRSAPQIWIFIGLSTALICARIARAR